MSEQTYVTRNRDKRRTGSSYTSNQGGCRKSLSSNAVNGKRPFSAQNLRYIKGQTGAGIYTKGMKTYERWFYDTTQAPRPMYSDNRTWNVLQVLQKQKDLK